MVGAWKVADCESSASPVTASRTIEVDLPLLQSSVLNDYLSNVPEVAAAAAAVFDPTTADSYTATLEVDIPVAYGHCPGGAAVVTVGSIDIDFGFFADVSQFTDAVAAELAANGQGTFVVDSVDLDRSLQLSLIGTGPSGTFEPLVNQGITDAVFQGPFMSSGPTGLGGLCVREECADNPCVQCHPMPVVPDDIAGSFTGVQNSGSRATARINFTLQRPDGSTVSSRIDIERAVRQPSVTFEPVELHRVLHRRGHLHPDLIWVTSEDQLTSAQQHA